MAVTDGSTPRFENLSGENTEPENGGEPSAAPGGATSTALIRVVDQPPALHRMHEGRVVRSAGRMLIGSPAPIPTLNDVLSHTPIFSGRGQRRWTVSGGAAVAFACMVAVGSAVALTGVLNRTIGHGTAGEGGAARASARTDAPPVAESLAVSEVRTGSGAADAAHTGAPHTDAPPARVAVLQETVFAARDVAGPAGASLPLSVSVPETGPEEYSFLMFRGLPAEVTISSGFRLKDSWAVSLRELDNLTLRAAPGYGGQFNLEVLLIKGRDTPAQSRVITVTIHQPGADGRAVARNAGSQVLTAAPPANDLQPFARRVATGDPQITGANAPPAISPEEEAPLLERASKLLESYDVSSARLLFEHLARQGSVKAALALGQTYDPVFFHTSSIRGMQPDVGKARQWYQKAAAMGSDEAAKRLSVIDTP